ncbi:MAG: hypothetical protein L6R48_05765 [Planctomycetes bacterium]|nr:hypothetical protein [Planctomycetota bacterium]
MTPIRTVCAACAAFSLLAAAEGPTISADTNRPGTSLYIPGEPVQVRLEVAGLTPTLRDLVLSLRVEDAKGRELEQRSLQVPADQGATWSTAIEAPVSGLGYYRLRAELSTGATLPQRGNRGPGYLTYAVVPDPATRRQPVPERTYFGMQGGFNDAISEVVPLLGVRWMMDGSLSWQRNEPRQAGEFAARALEAVLADPALKPRLSYGTYAAGQERRPWAVQPMHCQVFSNPPWAKPGKPDGRQVALTPEHQEAFRAYCTAVARANARLRPDLPVRVYEVAWEPVIPWGFTGTPAELVRIFELAHQGLHAGDPAALVVGPCEAGINEGGVQDLEALLKLGLARHLDGYSVHPYHPQPSEPAGIVRHIRETKALLRRYAGRDLPLFGTEMGYAHWGSPGNELEHGRCVVRQDLIMLGEGFRTNFAFYVHDLGKDVFAHDSGYGYMHNLTATPFGPDRVSPKPAAAAYAAMTWLLEGHVSAGAIEWLGDTAWGYAYEDGDDIVLALWDWGGRPRPVTLPVGAAEVEVLDWMGNGERRRTADGTLPLVLGEEPTYVRGAARSLWGAGAARPISLADGECTGFPGGAIALRGTLRAPQAGQAFTGELLVEPAAASGMRRAVLPVRLAAGQELALEHRLEVPLQVASGPYPVRLTLLDAAGRSVAAGGLRAEVRPPVAIERVRPLLRADGSRGIAVEVRDVQGGGQHGIVTTRLLKVPESERQTAFTLAPGATAAATRADRDLAVDATRLYTAEVGIRLDNGFAFSQQASLGFLPARRLARAPAIDGSFDDWQGIAPVELAGADRVVRSPKYHAGADDQRVALRCAWDERALYLAVAVRDDAFLQPETGAMVWKGDCLQLAFNADQGRVFARSGNGVADAAQRARQSELALALTAQGPQAWRHVSTVPERMPTGAITAADLPLGAVWKDGVLRYEAAIPWHQLGLDAAPPAGEAIGFALSANDLDEPGQSDPSALGLFDLKNPAGFGILTLTDGN